MGNSEQSIEFDVLLVGAGPASLACAIRLTHLAKARSESGDGLKIAILEKSAAVGDHILSGALFDHSVLTDLLPGRDLGEVTSMTKVTKDKMLVLTRRHSLPLPMIPPGMSERKNDIFSLGELTRWLARIAEESGVEIYTGEAAKKLLITPGGQVKGVVTGEKGLDKEGRQKENYQPGFEIRAKVTVLGEGSHGYLTKKLVDALDLAEGAIPQGYALGLKEIWKVSDAQFKPGLVLRTMGYPLGLDTFGGGFIYHYGQNLVALGLITSLDYCDPYLDPFECFQQWKEHPQILKQIRGGSNLSYGAKCIAEGGCFAVPRPYGHGFLIIGESAGLLNSLKLKGVPMAVGSGMMAAETIYDALLKGEYGAEALKKYKERLDQSWIRRELWRARNFHQGFHHGLIPGIVHAGFQTITGGRGVKKRFFPKKDYQCMHQITEEKKKGEPLKPDGEITFDRTTSVYASGTKHEEEQPCHLVVKDPAICTQKCTQEYGNPCQRFCPAQVYEMVEDEGGGVKLQISPSNCLHCKTCAIKDPYEVIDWELPEGGGGPRYEKM